MNDTSRPAFAEVAEADATGRTREIYDDFKASIGLPMVNLVYRHMAATPGCLEWAWASLKPHFVSGALQSEGDRLVAELNLGVPTSITPDQLREAQVDAQALSVITQTLDAYNRANPMNLIALAVLARELERPEHGEANMPPGMAAPAARPTVALPPMSDVKALPAGTRATLAVLAAQAGVAEAPVVPTLYRHLTDWPGFLEIAAETAATIVDDGRVDRNASALKTAAEAAAQRLPRYDTGLPPPSARQRDQLLGLIDSFPALIARMIVIGVHLRRGMPG